MSRCRGGGHVAGDEHRPRRLAHHVAREFSARRSQPSRNDDLDGQPEPSRSRDASTDRCRDQRRRSGKSSVRRLSQGVAAVGDRRHGGRRDHDAGHLHLRAARRRRRWPRHRALPGDRHPAPVHGAAGRLGHRAAERAVFADRRARCPGGRPMVSSFGLWGAASLVFAAVALGTVAVALGLQWAGELRQRQAAVRQLSDLTAGAAVAGSGGAFRDAQSVEAKWMQAIAARIPQLRGLGGALQQAAIPWTPQSFVALSVGLALAAALLVAVVFPVWPAVLLAAACTGALPYLQLRRKTKRRLDALEEQLPEAIDLIGRAMRAGHPLSAGLKMAGDETADPLSGELRRVFEEQRFGMPFEEAIMGLCDRVALIDVRILVTAILVQRDVGGNLAEVLDKIAYVI